MQICINADELQSFWRYHLPQISSSCPPLHHLVVAVGALHRTLKGDLWYPSTSMMSANEPLFALQQCNRAIQTLVERPSSETSSSVLLTSSILFMTFDILQNRLDSALHHLCSASKMLDDWYKTSRSVSPASEKDLIEQHISPMILRFRESADVPAESLTLKLAFRKRASATRSVAKDDHQLPLTFFNLSHASVCLQNAIEDAFEGIPRARLLSPAGRKEFCNNKLATIRLWKQRLRRFLATLEPNLPLEIQRRLCLLDIHYNAACCMFPAFVFEDEMLFDEQLPTFHKILNACRQVISLDAERTSSIERRMYFSFDIGIISPIYLVASRCRDPNLRKEATQMLLTSLRREGFWLSHVTGMVAREVVEIEEEGLRNIRSCKDVPLEKRAQLREMRYDPRGVEGETPGTSQSILYIRWRNYGQLEWKERSVSVPHSQGFRPPQKPYRVIVPEAHDSTQWKLLLGRKYLDESIELPIRDQFWLTSRESDT